MTVSGDDGSAAHPSAAESVNGRAPPRAETALARGRLLTQSVRVWLRRHRPEVMLVGPAAVYLFVTGALLWHATGVALAAIVTMLVAFFGPRVSADTMLTLYRAEPIAPAQGSALRAAIKIMSARAGLAHEPALAVVPSLAVGAFSVGSEPRLALLMTEGLLRRHSLREIVARAAHEIAHMRNGDLQVLALADTMTRLAQILFYAGGALLVFEALAWLAGEQLTGTLPILLLLTAPMANSQLQLALPRQREYDADRTAAALLGDANAMLTVIHMWEPDSGAFMDDFRVPVPQRHSPVPSPLRAHPDPAERAARLGAIDKAAIGPPIAITDEPLISLVGFGPIEMRPRNRWPGLWF